MDNHYSKPLITTIIPTYRRPKMLRRAIDSVLNQTYPRFQVSIYDNASGDGQTEQVVVEFARGDQRVKYHCHAHNIGSGKNFLYGMKHIETPFFSFLSDDDVILPEFYETAMEGFGKFPDAAFFAGSTIAMTDSGKVLYTSLSLWQREGCYAPPQGLFEILEGKHPIWTAIIFRKEVIEKVGILDLEVGPPADFDFVLRIAARFPFVICKKPCAIFVHHPAAGYCYYPKVDSHFLWPSWPKIIRNLKEDERIPLDVSNRAEGLLNVWLKRKLFELWFKAVNEDSFNKDAYRIAGILYNHCHTRMKAIFLYIIARIREHLPPIYYLLLRLNKIRRFFWPNKSSENLQNLQEEFGDYARFIKNE